jgi:hypothetical protein
LAAFLVGRQVFIDVRLREYNWRRSQGIMKIKCLILLGLIFSLLSCGEGGPNFGEKAKTMLTLLQNKNYDKCVDLAYKYHAKMASLSNEPQFKQQEMTAKIRSDFENELFNENQVTSIAYLFRFPCRWQILEGKTIATEEGYPVYRVFASVKYNSMDQSPDAVPLLLKAEEINYNNYKVKEIIFHFDLDTDNGFYLRWGPDKHVPW